MAERSKALRSGRSPLLWAWVRIPLLTSAFFFGFLNLYFCPDCIRTVGCCLLISYSQRLDMVSGHSRVAQWMRAGPITQRSVDRNHALLEFFLSPAPFIYCNKDFPWHNMCWSVGVVVITSALHAEGRQFDPGTDQSLLGCF